MFTFWDFKFEKIVTSSSLKLSKEVDLSIVFAFIASIDLLD